MNEHNETDCLNNLKEVFNREEFVVFDIKEAEKDGFTMFGKNKVTNIYFVYSSRIFHLFVDYNDAICFFNKL